MKRYKHIVIVGKRWFERTNGNTYHSVSVTIDGNLIEYRPFQYGYDDQYRQTAHEILQEAGYFPKTDDNMSDYSVFRAATMDKRDKFTFVVVDVSRKKDL